MKLVAPVRGIGPGTWGVDFVNAASEVGRPLTKICCGEPLVPALDVNGDFQMRAMKSSNLVRWVHSVLKGDVFTGHSAKATSCPGLRSGAAHPRSAPLWDTMHLKTARA